MFICLPVKVLMQTWEVREGLSVKCYVSVKICSRKHDHEGCDICGLVCVWPH